MNQLAQDKMGGLDGANLMDELANMDPDEMMKMIPILDQLLQKHLPCVDDLK